ncbi:MAG: pantoate--beta-alanine ligase [Thermoflavifilum sp.]|nr:pantoate--beta-alanine ligase [Thermoflavifilum sp.]
MQVVHRRQELSQVIDHWHAAEASIAFVPTMGALHEGHLSLIRAARRLATHTVVSIFVNPVQFNDPQDFALYPRHVDADIALLEAEKVDLLFSPEVEDVYPEGIEHLESYDLGRLEQVLEGAYRPGHFQGVARVMRRLLDMIKPEVLVMGEKDYQQCLVVQHLLQLLHMQVSFHMHPTVREADGLAMSSRNSRLTAEDRKKATLIYESLLFIRSHIQQLSFDVLQWHVEQQLKAAGFVVDYVTIVRSRDIQQLNKPINEPMRALIAASIHGVRLIDNMQVYP